MDACFAFGLLALVWEQVDLDIGVGSPIFLDGCEPFGAMDSYVQLLFILLVPHPNFQLSLYGVAILSAWLTVNTAQTVEALCTLGTAHNSEVGRVRSDQFLTFKTIFLRSFLHGKVNISAFLLWTWGSLCRTQK